MADGTFKPIEQIVVGDVIKTLSINGLDSNDENAWKNFMSTEFSATPATSTVVNVLDSTWIEYYKINGTLNITFEHPVFVKRDIDYMFSRVYNLMIGDLMLNENNEWVEITTIEKVEATVQTVNLNVEVFDLYYANGLLVHNLADPGKGPIGPKLQ
jgi:hypothetical protein